MPKESKPVVLVADDEPSTVAMLSSHLRTKGYTVLEAPDGDQAWELAHEHLPDLVLLDVMMPGMSGWEVCRKIREAVSLAHTGVIMLTGIGENLNEMTSPLYGADAYLDKPFEFSDLDEKITETIARRSAGALGRADAEDADDLDDDDNDDDDHDGDDDDDDDDAGLVKETLRAVTARKPAKASLEKPEAKPKAVLAPKPERAPKKPAVTKLSEPKSGPKPALAKAVARPAPKADKPPTAKAKPKPAAEASPPPAKKAPPPPAKKAPPPAKKAPPPPAKKAAPSKPSQAKVKAPAKGKLKAAAVKIKPKAKPAPTKAASKSKGKPSASKGAPAKKAAAKASSGKPKAPPKKPAKKAAKKR